ncbi:RDD family protein [Streptomyces sp. NPDC057257]|uniref:RDD family protein n=1 Tax=Streptomyces sp. NPDC057257 TaxID=3346071 RepID=UPI003628DF01
MSAPTPAPGDDRPREGYYPDPSIPGYVRYWNGAAWVPGTSRPAPSDGESLAAPPGSAPAAPSVEETGPHFFDEDPEPRSAPPSQHGNRPEPASAWGADRSHQAGFGGDQDRRVSWGSDPRTGADGQGGADGRAGAGGRAGSEAHPAPDGRGASQPAGHASRTDGTATIPPAGHDSDGGALPDGTFMFRRPTVGSGPAADSGQQGAAGGSGTGAAGTGGASAQGAAGTGGAAAQGAPGFGGAPGAGGAAAQGAAGLGAQGPAVSGAVAPGAGRPAGSAAPGIPNPATPAPDEGTMTFRALSPRTGQQGGAQTGGTGAPASGSEGQAAAGSGTTDSPGFGAGKAAADRAAAAQAGSAAQGAQSAPTALSGPQHPAPVVPQQPSGPQSTPGGQTPAGRPQAGHASAGHAAVGQSPANQSAAPMTSGPGGGQPSWAQQVHRLAGASEGEQPVAPWKPPVEDVFQAAARRQAAARPAGLGKRLAARLLDTVVVGAVTAAVAVPLGTKAIDHINDKIDAARLSGETVTVWLLDGTTSVCFGVILAVLLLFGVLYEALPTAKWGRTLGKKLLGLEVRDIEAHEPPTFGGALRRWLVYVVPGLLGIGVLGVLWCVFDRPWHQCWHDKAARTFVAG